MSEKSVFGKAKTNLFRATQKISEKLGRADETVDLTFNQDKDRFELHYKAVKRINETTIKVLSLFRELTVQQATVIDDLKSIYEPSCALYNASVKGQEVAKRLDASRIKFDEVMREYYVELLSKYQGQFAEISDRIAERNVRRLDMDRYAGHLKRAMEKGDREKEASNKVKLEAAKQNYRALNEELLHDLPLLYEDRVKFFGPLMATYYGGLGNMYKESRQISSEMLPLIANIDRTTQHDHPRVTTDPGLSSASHKSSAVFEETPPNSNRLSMSLPSSQARPALPAPPTSTEHSGPRAKVLFDFNAQDPSELPLKAGQIVNILKQDGDWWEGELNGKKGLLPSNYVQII